MWTYKIFKKIDSAGKEWFSGCLKNNIFTLWFYVNSDALMFDVEEYSIFKFMRSWVSDEIRLEDELKKKCNAKNLKFSKIEQIK